MIGMIGMAVIAAGVAVMAAEEAEDTTTVEVLHMIIIYLALYLKILAYFYTFDRSPRLVRFHLVNTIPGIVPGTFIAS